MLTLLNRDIIHSSNPNPTVVISTGKTAESTAGTLRLQGGSSEQGAGGNVDIIGGKSTNAEIGGRVLLGTFVEQW
jgi:hypothetical protein